MRYFISIFAILSLCFPAITFAEDREKPLSNETIVIEEKTDTIPIKKLNLSKEEKVKLYEKAKKYNVDTESLTNEEIDQQIIAKENLERIEKAKQSGIDTEGLSLEQVNDKINEYEANMKIKNAEDEKSLILEEAGRYGIDITGLSYEQIKEMVYEKMMPELIEKAKELGINTNNLSYAELLTKIKEVEINLILDATKK